MNRISANLARVGLLLAAVLPAVPALAQANDGNGEEPAISVDASIGIVSDYRFRGVSLSDFEPAVQPSLTVTHESGFYANVWGSNIADYGGADVEIDLAAGWSGDIADGVTADVYAIYYVYPGASELHYAEFNASLSRSVGAGSISAELNYAPAQQGTGDMANLYLGLSGEMPLGSTPVTLRSSFGFEDGAFGTDKLDWQVGAEYDLGRGFAAGIGYVDSYRSRLREGRAGIVASLHVAF